MEIRKVTPADDFDAIARIYALIWKAAYRGIVPQRFLDELSPARWAGALPDSPWQSFVAVEDGGYVGTCAVCAARDEAMAGWGELVSIYLLPEYFGKGIGKILLEWGLTELREMGCKNAYLWVLEENKAARRFYEKNGFSPTPDMMQLDVGGKELTEMRYVICLKAQEEDTR